MRSARLWPLLALIPWLAGCPAILSQQPLGDEIVKLDPRAVDGMWLGPEGLMGVRVVDASKGRFTYWKAHDYEFGGPLRCRPPSKLGDTCESENELVFEGTCTLRRQELAGAQWPFFFVELRPRDGAYSTTGVAISDGKSFAVVYPVSRDWRLNERLRELVAKHALPGRVDAKGVTVLASLSAEHYKIILSQESSLFDWRQGFPLIKLPDELDPCKKRQTPHGKVDDSPDFKR